MILLKMTEDLTPSIVGILSSDFFADCSGKSRGKRGVESNSIMNWHISLLSVLGNLLLSLLSVCLSLFSPSPRVPVSWLPRWLRALEEPREEVIPFRRLSCSLLR